MKSRHVTMNGLEVRGQGGGVRLRHDLHAIHLPARTARGDIPATRPREQIYPLVHQAASSRTRLSSSAESCSTSLMLASGTPLVTSADTMEKAEILPLVPVAGFAMRYVVFVMRKTLPRDSSSCQRVSPTPPRCSNSRSSWISSQSMSQV